MILCPLEPPAASGSDHGFISAWDAVEPLQRASYERCWMITQPSHAALAGEIAAKLAGAQVPRLEAELIRAIALHDAGWGMPDAQAVMRSRSVQHSPPCSFLQVSVAEFLTAWTQSIEVALSTSPAGGYMVSRHFWRLGKHRLNSSRDSAADRARLEEFLDSEAGRQKKLTSKQSRSTDELETLTDVLQFCDLMSLYLCCGSLEDVEFPEYFGVKIRATREPEGLRLSPALIPAGTRFDVAALKHPANKSESGRKVKFLIV
ncbi:MAG: DUF3891 family protein [Actinomycetota bacterium]